VENLLYYNIMLLQLRFKISRKQNTGIVTYSKRMVFLLQMKLRQRKRLIMQNEKLFTTLVRITRNRIKNGLKARGIITRRSKRDRKKAVEALEKAGKSVPLDMLEAIPDPEKTIASVMYIKAQHFQEESSSISPRLLASMLMR
jgi:hypothetical protein